MRLIVALLLVLSLSSATCQGSISQRVPAVVGQGGGLVDVSAHLVPGNGNTYATVFPRIGLMTQESIDDAVSYAYELSGRTRDCDILMNFTMPMASDYIEGPSAGTALTVMTYALLENRSMRKDAIITGTIESSGEVGPVGGLYEKAREAANQGARYFITPVENFYELMLLRNLERDYGITVLQARNVDEVIGFMIYNKSIDQEGKMADRREIPKVPDYDSSDLASFIPVAKSMIELENRTLGKVAGSDNITLQIQDYFGNELDRQASILEQGYLFSAANEAFLDYVDISTINVILAGNPDLPRKKGDIGKCLTSLRRPQLTDSNFEWVIGADQRESWAYDVLNSTAIDGGLITDEKYVAYNELMQGDAWCNVAGSLLDASPAGGTALNESAWKRLAEDTISAARTTVPDQEDTRMKLRTAESAYGRGDYGAAIYDATYVTAMQGASGNMTDIDPKEESLKLLGAKRKSLWGRVYQSQGAFLYETGSYESAYRILALARELDAVTEKMAMAPAAQQPVQEAGCTGNMLISGLIAVMLTILIFLFLAMLIGKHGSNSQGTGKADGAQQKKG